MSYFLGQRIIGQIGAALLALALILILSLVLT
jgi:hypothetical protein